MSEAPVPANGMIIFDGRLYAMTDGIVSVLKDGQFVPLMVRRPGSLRSFGDGAIPAMRKALIEALAPLEISSGVASSALGHIMGVLVKETAATIAPWNAAVMEAYRQRAEAAEAELAMLRMVA